MNISKNQIWVLIGIVAIGVIALVSDVKVKIEVGTEDYANYDECYFKEVLKCPGGLGDSCGSGAHYYCETLELPEFEPKE
jgi:hypothetical protein